MDLFKRFAGILVIGLSQVATAQIPNANDVLAGIEVGREVSYLNTQSVDAGYAVLGSPTNVVQPTGVMRATNIPEAVKTSYLSVVRITGDHGNGTSSRGSGTYLGSGLVITNRHVVQGGRTFYITLKNGKNIPASLLRVSNTEADLALLQVPDLPELKPVPVAMKEVRQGQVVYPSGFDQGRMEWHTIWPARVHNWYNQGSWSSGGIGARRGSISGNSGGPVFNSAGELIAPLWGTNGSTSLGNGDTTAVCFRSTRFFLLPWRARIMRALRSRWNQPPIIINIGNGSQYQPPPQQQYSPPPQQGYKIEGHLIPLREVTRTSNEVPIVPLKNYDDSGWESSSTQYGYCPPGSGSQYCDPGYGQPSYGQPSYGGGAQRPVLPDPPAFQPDPEPKELELDYDKLADALLPKMSQDERFRGPAGKQGPAGPQGKQGQEGKSVTPQELSALGNVLMQQMVADQRFRGPKGDKGEITPEQISELTEEIKRGMTRRIVVIDGKTKEVLDDETYGLDEPFVFDIRKLERKSSIK